ncbi:hypothetical protein [Photobacterium sp. 53610]|uniref:hypothetical protein n=1 Tax=Photobacterium sp. 53610 TaxID=3102789 RepID=UPI002ED98ED7
MYKFSHIGIIGLTLVLGGCGNDVNVARLNFDRPVADGFSLNDDEKIQQVYLDGLHQIFKEAGIAPEVVKIHFDDEKRNVRSLLLSTSEKNKITETQKASIQSAFEKILADKKSTMNVRFLLRPEDMETEKAEYREEAARLKKEFTTELTVKEVMVGISYSMMDSFLMAMQGTTQTEGEAFCTVAMTLSPALPFSAIVVDHKDEKPVGMSVVRSRYAVPTDIRLAYPHLQAKLDNHQILLSTEITNNSPRESLRRIQGRGGMNQLEIELGSLGTVRHEYGKVDYSTSSSLDQRCRNMAAQLGRPFTFTMGDSLDRLESVTFY